VISIGAPSCSRKRSVTLAGAVLDGLLIRMNVVKNVPDAPSAWNHSVAAAGLPYRGWRPYEQRSLGSSKTATSPARFG
jgi:hypothetical protein